MSDIKMGNLNVLKDLADADLFDADGKPKANTEASVISKNGKINMCVEITGNGLDQLRLMPFLEFIDPADPSKGMKVKQDSSGNPLASRWTVSYFAESFGPGSNDVVLGTKSGFLNFNVAVQNVSPSETKAQIDLANVQDQGDGNAGPIKPGVYKITSVVQWDMAKDIALSGHAAFAEGGTIEVVNE